MQANDREPGDELQRIHLYFEGIMASMAPIATFDGDMLIRFVNDSFREEFPAGETGYLGVDFLRLVPMGARYRREFQANIRLSEQKKVQNCEFNLRRKTFGYTLFRLENEVGIILKDITEQKKLQRKVATLHTRLLRLQEAERQRLSRELHDSVGQTILAAKLNFISFKKDPERFADRFDIALSLIDKSSQELREIYTDLYPASLRELGLESTIRSLAKNILEVRDCSVDLEMSLMPMPAEIEVNLFRILQEIITNAAKHSQASHMLMKVQQSARQLNVFVQDNGRGFDVAKARIHSQGYGIENIHRRVEDMSGAVSFSSTPGGGTTIDINIPL